jgi:Transcription termination factor nusG
MMVYRFLPFPFKKKKRIKVPGDRPLPGVLDLTCLDKRAWGVLLAKQQKHALVVIGLSACGVEYFLPVVENTFIINGRHVHRKHPLLGRYILFVIDELWKNLSRLRGVAGIILNVEKLYPARVDDKALDAIRAMCVDNVYSPRAVASSCGFVYGQRVTSEHGPLAYKVGRYDGAASRHREVAMFNLFGREQRIVFKAGELIAA